MHSNRAVLVVSMPNRWREYIPLAKRLARMNSPLVIAQFSDIDASQKTLKGYQIRPNGTIKACKSSLPKNIWFKQTSMGIAETIAAVKKLESAGCVNVNSSEAIELATDKVKTAAVLSHVCNQGTPKKFGSRTLQAATAELMLPGVRWVKPINASLGQGVMRILGHGKTAIVSRRMGGEPVHKIVNERGLALILATSFKQSDFMVQDNLGSIEIGGNNFEIRMIMRRVSSGWKPSCRIARAGKLISNPNFASKGLKVLACSAEQALKMAFPDRWESILASCDEKARHACLAFQASLSSPDGAGELGVDLTVLDGVPTVIEINSVPDLTFVDHAASGGNGILSLMKSAGIDGNISSVPEAEVEESRAGIVEPIRNRLLDENYKIMVEREMSHQGIWLQPGGKVAILEGEKISMLPFDDAMKLLLEEAKHAAKLAKKEEHGDQTRLTILLDYANLAIHRICLLKEIYYLSTAKKYVFAMTKKAEYDYSSSGPNMPSNIIVPTEQVIELMDDEDSESEGWLNGIRKYLPRRPSEQTTPAGKYIGYQWQIENLNLPESWDEYNNKGQGDYKIRPELQR